MMLDTSMDCPSQGTQANKHHDAGYESGESSFYSKQDRYAATKVLMQLEDCPIIRLLPLLSTRDIHEVQHNRPVPSKDEWSMANSQNIILAMDDGP